MASGLLSGRRSGQEKATALIAALRAQPIREDLREAPGKVPWARLPRLGDPIREALGRIAGSSLPRLWYLSRVLTALQASLH